MVRFQTFEQYHNKKNIGSTNIRVHQLVKYWPEADLYKYGEKPDVLVFQKVYATPDYDLPLKFNGLKILDICDPDWLEGAMVKRTVDGVDAVTCPTQAIADFIKQLTDKPVRVIKDRFDLEPIPPPKKHKDKLKYAVWFGYRHNAELLWTSGAIHALESRGIALTVVSQEDPGADRFANDPEKFRYRYKPYDEKTIYQELKKADIAVLPKGTRPQDRFKSENKTIKAHLVGLPTPHTAEEIEQMVSPEARTGVARENYQRAIEEYDVRKSVQEYQDLVTELTKKRTNVPSPTPSSRHIYSGQSKI